jgi:Ca-activated chloride channel family protein
MLHAKRLSFRSIWVAVLIVIGCSGPKTFAQNSTEDVHIQPRTPAAPKEPDADPSLKSHTKPLSVNVEMVRFLVITDPRNRLVTGLDRDNFNLFEGKERQEIKTFSSEDAPVSLGVIFDMSGSMSSKIERAREAVIEFCKTANPQDEFFMVTFADKPEEISDFTTSVEDIQGKLVYTVPKGRTALLDAIYLGVSKMRQARYPKKAMLIISDGGDNHSRYTEGEIRSTVKEADVLIYAIGIYDHFFPTDEERLGPTLLSDLTELTGGRAFTIDNPNDLADVSTKIGIELRNQYLLGYRPKNPVRDGKWRKIKVKLLPPKGLPPLRVYAKTVTMRLRNSLPPLCCDPGRRPVLPSAQSGSRLLFSTACRHHCTTSAPAATQTTRPCTGAKTRRSTTPSQSAPQSAPPPAATSPALSPRSSASAGQEPTQSVPPPATAPQAPDATDDGGFVFKKSVEEVVLHATVFDDKQRFVTNLERNAFTVYEDGHPQTITSFRVEDIPVSIGIVVDNSGSMREKRQKINAAALNLVRASNPNDEVFVVNFNDEYYLDQDSQPTSINSRKPLIRLRPVEVQRCTRRWWCPPTGRSMPSSRRKLL